MSDSSAQQTDQPSNLDEQTSSAPQSPVSGAQTVVMRPAGTVLTIHPLACLFPVISGSANEEFARDVADHGLREPITVIGDQVLDGANRYRVCRDLGLPFITQEWDGQGSPLDFVIRKNLHRRQLSESQRALVAADVLRIKKVEQVQREADGQENGSVTDLTPAPKGRMRDQVATMTNVSSGLVGSAQKVLNKGIPELVDLVRNDEVPVSAAADVADLPEAEQRAIVERGPNAVREASKLKRDTTRSGAKDKVATTKPKTTRRKKSRPPAAVAAPDTDDDSPDETDPGEDEAFLVELQHETGITDSALFAVDAQAARRVHALLDTELDVLRHRLLERNLSPTQSPLFRELSRLAHIMDANGWRPCPCSRTCSAETVCSTCRGVGYLIELLPDPSAEPPVAGAPVEQAVPAVPAVPAEPGETAVRRKRRRADNVTAVPTCP